MVPGGMASVMSRIRVERLPEFTGVGIYSYASTSLYVFAYATVRETPYRFEFETSRGQLDWCGRVLRSIYEPRPARLFSKGRLGPVASLASGSRVTPRAGQVDQLASARVSKWTSPLACKCTSISAETRADLVSRVCEDHSRIEVCEDILVWVT